MPGLGVDPNKKTEFAYDLARGAEIIFSLVTQQGQPPARGSLALPDDSALIPGLTPLPAEFRELCKWAPRTPADGNQAPYASLELFRASKKWLLPSTPSDFLMCQLDRNLEHLKNYHVCLELWA